MRGISSELSPIAVLCEGERCDLCWILDNRVQKGSVRYIERGNHMDIGVKPTHSLRCQT